MRSVKRAPFCVCKCSYEYCSRLLLLPVMLWPVQVCSARCLRDICQLLSGSTWNSFGVMHGQLSSSGPKFRMVCLGAEDVYTGTFQWCCWERGSEPVLIQRQHCGGAIIIWKLEILSSRMFRLWTAANWIALLKLYQSALGTFGRQDHRSAITRFGDTSDVFVSSLDGWLLSNYPALIVSVVNL